MRVHGVCTKLWLYVLLFGLLPGCVGPDFLVTGSILGCIWRRGLEQPTHCV
jgi:hypothetical protein